MRSHVCGALAVCVLLAYSGVGRADDQAEALKIVDAAIKAAGGEAKLGKLKLATLKGKGTFYEGGLEGTFTLETTVQGVDRFRLSLEMNIKDQNVKAMMILNGDNAWRKIEEMAEDAPAEIIPAMKAELHALRMTQMLTPLKDKEMKLSPLGEVKVNDRPTLGIKVAKKDHPDVDLYFDKETHLPLKCELKIKERGDKEVTTEWLFSNFKEWAGVMHPKKIVLNRDGTKLMEMEISELKPEEKVDEGTFAKP
jgi:hypothetical protein